MSSVKPLQLAIIGSGKGSLMLAIAEAIQRNLIHATIRLIISNLYESILLQRAALLNIQAFYLDYRNKSREALDMEINQLCERENIDLIILAGYNRIVSKELTAPWQNKIINVHPSLLPKFAGLMDEAVHKAVLEAKEIQSGCTVHYVTDELDAGPIIVQKRCPVFPEDTIQQLKSRVQALEAEAIVETIIGLAKTYR